jgi:hypothetical protein
MHTHSPDKPKKFKQLFSARKPMATVIWDTKIVIMVEFMQQGTTITSEVYCETPRKKLRRAIQNKRRGMLTYGIVLLNWELFEHPLTALISPRETTTCLPA